MMETTVIDDEVGSVKITCGDYLKLSNYDKESSWFRIVNGYDRHAIVAVKNGYFRDSIERSTTFNITVDQLVDETEYLELDEVEAVVKSDDARLGLSNPKPL